MTALRAAVIWGGFVTVIVAPVAWRDPVYIIAGFAGIAALGLLLVQPVLAAGWLPGITIARGRRLHRWTGAALVLAVVIHVGGLWVTSPPDVVDALLFVSPTPFSVWGVLAMWAVFGAAVLVGLRARLKFRPKRWRQIHTGLALVTVTGTVIHALQIEGTMESLSKLGFSLLVLAVTIRVLVQNPVWKNVLPFRSRG